MHDDHLPGEEPDPRRELFEEALKPRDPIGRVAHKMAERDLRFQKAYVEEPGMLRRMFRSDVLWFLFSIALLLTEAFLPEDSLFLDALIGAMLGWIIGRAGLKKMRSAQAYRNGWLDGRRACYDSLDEARQRGLDDEQWRHGELERDFNVLRNI